jgi:hypothetical integral membrane protein (TIGR02206 family)
MAVQQQFVPYGPSHQAVIVVAALGAAALVVLGRSARGAPAQTRISRVFAVGFAVLLVPLEAYWLLPGHFGIGYSLPLQLCDLAAFAAVWALWSHSPTAFALTYYWGLTLTAQAFVSPEVNGPDFPALEFIMFFAMHTLVVWAAIYLTWGAGLRPNWRSYRIALLATLCWAVVMFGFNEVAGTNYGFLNAKPLTASLFDLLGPWPWYLAGALALGASAWALITWPWVRQGAPRRVPSAGHVPD